MKPLKRPRVLLLLALTAVLIIGIGIGVTAALVGRSAGPSGDSAEPARTATPEPTADEAPPAPAPTTTAPPVQPVPDCPDANVLVSTAAELSDALTEPQPGTVIQLADGIYEGEFVATGDGTPEQPIMLCVTRESVLDGGAIDGGYVLHLDGASHWVLQGFTVQNGQKGVMADGTTNSVIANLRVQQIGDEAIHLRAFSTDNQVTGNEISDTGLRREKFGEGIYIGTAESNWCDISNCEPDMSDRNVISGNSISGTTAESVDIKEGTSSGRLVGNTFDGSAIVEDGADSWVDVKGNAWIIEGNTGKNSPLDGYQTHEILDGWGTDNVFRNNTANVNGDGFGYSLTPARDNVVECNNKASNAAEGLSNESCARS